MTMKGKKRFWAKVLAFMLIASMMVGNMATSSYAAPVDETLTTTEASTDGTVKPVVEEPKKDEQKTDEQKQEITEKDESEEDAEKLKTSTDETKKDDMTSTEKTEEEKKTETPENANVGETSEEDSKVEDENTLKEEAVPEEVQAFLDAVAKLPSADEVTAENVEEIGNVLGDEIVSDGYGLASSALEAEAGEEADWMTEEISAACVKYEELFLAVEKVTGTGSSTYGSTQYQPYYSASILDITKGTVYSGATRNQARITAFVGEQWNFQRLPTNTYYGSLCGHAMFVCAPKYYNRPSLKSYDSTIVEDKGYTIGTWIDNGSMLQMNGSDCLQWDFKALKPGETIAQSHYYVRWDNYSNVSGGCPICGRSTTGFDNRGIYYEYQDNIPITVNARYQLNYDLNGGTGFISPTTTDVSTTSATLNVTGQKPANWTDSNGNVYTFKGWADSSTATEPNVSGSVTLNWSEGLGGKANPVSKTLYAVWQKNGAPEAPTRDDLYGILRNFVKVHDVTNMHGDKEYCTWGNNTVAGHYESSVGSVYEKDGAYLCNVTLYGDVYAAMYSMAEPFGVGEEHTLDNAEDTTKTITLKYNSTEEKWQSESGASKGTVLVTFNVTCGETKKELTDFSKKLIKNASDAPSEVVSNASYKITYPGDEKIKIPSENGKVTLLYKITVIGSDGAAYKVTDLEATKVYGDGTQTGNVITGIISGGKAEIYVIKSFVATEIQNGNVTNKATLESGNSDTKDPTKDKDSESTPASKTHTITVNFETEDGDELRDPITEEKEHGEEYNYPLDVNTVGMFSLRAASPVVPQTITGKDGKKYSLDTVLTSKDELDKLSGTLEDNVTVNLIYSLDEDGTGGVTDGIPDRYQAKVIYTAGTKGTINGQESKVEYLTIRKNGKMAEEGTIDISGATATANNGQFCTGWIAAATSHQNWTHQIDLGSATIEETQDVPAKSAGKTQVSVYTFTAQYITAPSREDVPGILDPDGTNANFEFVTIDCVNTTINPLHDDITYSLVGNNDVIVGDISKDGNEYLCKVTVKAAPYVMKYDESRNEKHTLVDSTRASAELTLKWNADKNAWEPKDENAVTFEVRCGAPAANIDMTCNYSYILDANEAKEGTVNATLPVVIKDSKASVNVADYKDYDGIDGLGTKTYEFKSAIVTKADGATVSVEDKDGILTFDAVQDATYKVTINYELKEKSDKKVTVQYVDEAGNVLGEVSENNKKYDDPYDVSEKTTGTYTDAEGNNYMIIDVDADGDPAIGTVTKDIVVKVNCTLDNIGPDGRPDNVPDKYQATVTFQAVNGTVTGAGTDGTYKTVLTLTNPDIMDEKNPDGWATAAAGGKAALLAVPTTNPNAGYGNGTWNAVPRVGMEITEDRTFVITYTSTTPTNPPTTPTTPPTGGGGTGGGGTPDPTPTPTPTAVLPIAPTVIPAATPTPIAPAETPEAEPVEEIEDAETPLANDETPTEPEAVKIEEEEVPLASGKSWALLNLILAILTVVVSVVLLVGYFFGKKKDQEEDDEVQAYQDEEQQEELKRKGLARILSILPAVVSVIFFILTENMRNPMIFVDKWTLWMVVFAIANVALAILSKKTRKDDDDNKQKPGYEMA